MIVLTHIAVSRIIQKPFSRLLDGPCMTMNS